MVVLGITTPKGVTQQQVGGLYPVVGDLFYQEAFTGTTGRFGKGGSKYYGPLPGNPYEQPPLVLPKRIKGKTISKGKFLKKKIQQPKRSASFGARDARTVLKQSKAKFGRIVRRRKLNLRSIKKMSNRSSSFGQSMIDKALKKAMVKAGAAKNKAIKSAMVKAGAAKNKAISGLQKGTVKAIQAPFKAYNKTFAGKLGKAVVTSKYVGAPSRYIAKLTGARGLSKYPALLRSNRPTRKRAARFGGRLSDLKKKIKGASAKQMALVTGAGITAIAGASKARKALTVNKIVKNLKLQATDNILRSRKPLTDVNIFKVADQLALKKYLSMPKGIRSDVLRKLHSGLRKAGEKATRGRILRFGSTPSQISISNRLIRQSKELKTLGNSLIKQGKVLKSPALLKRGKRIVSQADRTAKKVSRVMSAVTAKRPSSYGQKKKTKCSSHIKKTCCPGGGRGGGEFMTRQQCKLFMENDGRFNPITGRYIIPQGPTWNRLMSQCRSLGMEVGGGSGDNWRMERPGSFNVGGEQSTEEKESVVRPSPMRKSSSSASYSPFSQKRAIENTSKYTVFPDEVVVRNSGLFSPIEKVFKVGDTVLYQGRGDSSPQEYEIYQFGRVRFELVNSDGEKKRPKISELITQNPSGPILRGGGSISSGGSPSLNSWGRRYRQRKMKYNRRM